MVPAMSGRAITHGWKRSLLASLLAYALVVQGALLALSGAMHVRAAELPPAILCLKADDSGSAHRPGQPDHAADHNLCCLAGCSSGPGAAGPLPVAASLADRLSAAMALEPGRASADRVIAPSLPPVGSRAPPRVA
jgi:hypothetical protein